MSVPKAKMKKLIKSREVTDKDRDWGLSDLVLRLSFDEWWQDLSQSDATG